VALLDLADDPAQLGWLRSRGLIGGQTTVAAIYVDHRVPSEQEFARRCRMWRALLPADGDVLRASPFPGSGLSQQHQSGERGDWLSPDPEIGSPAHGQAAGQLRDQSGGTQRSSDDSASQEIQPSPASHRPPTAQHPSQYQPGGTTLRAPQYPPRRVLVLGGARSGKSAEAELRLAAEPDVTYIAAGPASTGSPDLAGQPPDTSRGDAEWAARIAAHRARRPPWWRTVETTDLAAVLRAERAAVLIDGIGTWLAAVMDECGAWTQDPDALRRTAARIDELIRSWRQTRARVVAVSDETGWGIVPQTAAGRLFRDQLGRLNQLLAAESEEAVLVVAGRVLTLPS